MPASAPQRRLPISSAASAPGSDLRRRRLRWLLGLAAAAGIGLVVVLATQHAGFRDALTGAVTASIAWLRAAGPGVFFAGMAVLPAFGFPLLPFTLAAGPAFADRMGVTAVALCAVGAVAVNVTLSYALAAKAFRPVVLRLMARLGYRLPSLPPGTDWHAVLIVRLTPGPPFWVQSYLLGLMRLPWIPYLVGSIAVPSLYLVGVIVAGDALWSGRLKPALAALMVLGFVGAVVRFWRARQLRAGHAAGSVAPAHAPDAGQSANTDGPSAR